MHYRLVLSGPLPQAIVKLFHTRFGIVDLVPDRTSTTPTGIVNDQPALRALLGRIWDTGGTVRPPTPVSMTPLHAHPPTLPNACPGKTAIKEDR